MEDQARRLHLRQTVQTPIASDAMVLISAADSDQETADRIGDTLDDNGVGYEIASEQDAIDDLVQEKAYQGLMVTYGSCEQKWAKDRVRQCRSIMLGLKDRAPVCAVYDQPRPDKPRLGIKFPNLHLLSALQAPDFQRYVQALQGPATP